MRLEGDWAAVTADPNDVVGIDEAPPFTLETVLEALRFERTAWGGVAACVCVVDEEVVVVGAMTRFPAASVVVGETVVVAVLVIVNVLVAVDVVAAELAYWAAPPVGPSRVGADAPWEKPTARTRTVARRTPVSSPAGKFGLMRYR